MNCYDTLQQVCDQLCEDLDSPLCLEIREHLESCPKCCAQVDSLKGVVYLYQNSKKTEVPDAVDDRLWKVLNLCKPE